MNSRYLKVLLACVVLAGMASFFYLDLSQYLSFSYMKAKRLEFQDHYQEHQALTLSLYFLIYVITTALSLPGAAMLTLIGGFLFGVVTGTLVISFASTLGATLAFLVARFLLRDMIQARFSEKLKAINEGIKKEGVFYLFSLRLIPIFPFFIINLVMGLTPIRTVQFFVVSQIGMLPGTIVYVNAGTQLGQLESLKGILSPQLLLSFVLLGAFPLIAKKLMSFIQKRRS